MNARACHYVVFRLDGQRYALSVDAVERVVHAVEVTSLPNAPGIVLGVVDLGGRIVPVLNLRQRFGLPSRALDIADHLLVAHFGQRTVALVVDDVQGVTQQADAEIINMKTLVPPLEHIDGILRLDDGLALIHSLEPIFCAADEQALDEALQHEPAVST